MVRRAEILAVVIDLESVGTGPPGNRPSTTVGPRQVTVVLMALLAVVLVAGSLAGRRDQDRPRHRLDFDEPAAAAQFDSTVGGATAGAGESASGLDGASAPVRPPHRIPAGW